jgi:hypothetical protein
MTETYEQLRDSATGEAGEVWRRADREESNLRATYRQLQEDPRYSAEHKAERAWAAYERAAEKIAADRTKSRELLEKRVRSGKRLATPMPDGESLITSDANKLLASQNEAARIVRTIDRREKSGAGPFKPNKIAILKQEYRRGLDVGDVQGGAICRGVLSAAEELGVDTNAVVDSLRKQSHRDSLERAQHAERLLFTIGGKPPEPPFLRPGARPRGGDMHTSGGPMFLVGGGKDKKPLAAGGSQYSAGKAKQGRRRAWK